MSNKCPTSLSRQLHSAGCPGRLGTSRSALFVLFLPSYFTDKLFVVWIWRSSDWWRLSLSLFFSSLWHVSVSWQRQRFQNKILHWFHFNSGISHTTLTVLKQIAAAVVSTGLHNRGGDKTKTLKRSRVLWRTRMEPKIFRWAGAAVDVPVCCAEGVDLFSVTHGYELSDGIPDTSGWNTFIKFTLTTYNFMKIVWTQPLPEHTRTHTCWRNMVQVRLRCSLTSSQY